MNAQNATQIYQEPSLPCPEAVALLESSLIPGTPDVSSPSAPIPSGTTDQAPTQKSVELFRVTARMVIRPVRTFGRFFEITAQAFTFLAIDIVRFRHPWADVASQAWFILTVTVIPAFLVSIPFGVIVAVQAGNVIQQVGAASISGAAGGLGVIQQGAPIVAALLLGGAAGSAVATDLGARSIREEIDALRVMGINPVQRLVAPRLSAIIFVSPLLCIFIIFVGLFAGYFVNVGMQSGTPGSYLASFASFAGVNDLIVSLLKTLLFGVVVIMVACQRGLEASGGPRGVADAVNGTVVIGVVTVMVLNAVITQIVTLFMPTKLG